MQTERAAHEAWGKLTMKSPRAAAVMHKLVAMMGHQNAVVISQKTLAKLLGCSIDTIKRAVRELCDERWIDIVRINGPGTVAAYVVNSAVAWGERRDLIGVMSIFHAAVVADAEDQPEGTLERTDLRRVPMIYPPEEALPAGNGEPGAQIALPGMEPVIEGVASSDIPEHFEQAVAAAITRSEPTEGGDPPDPRATLDRIRRESAARRERERREAAERREGTDDDDPSGCRPPARAVVHVPPTCLHAGAPTVPHVAMLPCHHAVMMTCPHVVTATGPHEDGCCGQPERRFREDHPCRSSGDGRCDRRPCRCDHRSRSAGHGGELG